MKHTKKILSLLLVLALIIGTVATLTVSAAGDTIYVRVPSTYGTPYCYTWNSDSDKDAVWPGTQMTSEGDGVYSYTPSKTFANVIFNNGSGTQTADLVYPGANNIYDLSTGTWEIYNPAAAEPSISISKKDGSSFKTETVTVTVTVKNADSAYYTVDGGSQKSFSDSVEVTLGASTAVDSTTTLFVSATNANGTVTSSATYTKKDASSSGGNGSDGATSSALDGYYGTNPDGMVGKRATITIDGSFSDWSEDMLIAQGAAWDIANHYKGGHENCVLDTYALYAAWDDNNLYVAWQMLNTTDTWAPMPGDGSLSDGGRVLDVPLILALNTGSDSAPMTNKLTSGGNIWGVNLDFTTDVDHLLYMSGKPGLGEPAIFTSADDSGNTNYTTSCNKFSSVGVQYKMAEGNICSEIWGLNYSQDPSDVTNPDADWVDYKTFKGSSGTHNTTYDSFYEIKIPFDALGIDASDIESNGIGAMVIATRGESGIDCIPFDLTMLDNALDSYSQDISSSAEKEDTDNITVPLARIGKLLSGGTTPTPTPKPTEPDVTPTEPDVQPTQPDVKPTEKPAEPDVQPTEKPTNPVNPDKKYFLGDADLSGNVNIKDATAVQKHVAALEILKDKAASCADADIDAQITIKDATEIQKYVAGLLDDTLIGEYL